MFVMWTINAILLSLNYNITLHNNQNTLHILHGIRFIRNQFCYLHFFIFIEIRSRFDSDIAMHLANQNFVLKCKIVCYCVFKYGSFLVSSVSLIQLTTMYEHIL